LIPKRGSARLDEFLQDYMDRRTDVKPATKVNWRHTSP